jgi:hypothetical protein
MQNGSKMRRGDFEDSKGEFKEFIATNPALEIAEKSGIAECIAWDCCQRLNI